jgi:DNA-binding response OmpR family regulator
MRMNSDEQEGLGMTVLLIEDDRQLAGIVRTYLEHAGYQVILAETGEEGMEQAQRVRPHLVLLDLMLPLRSGQPAICS